MQYNSARCLFFSSIERTAHKRSQSVLIAFTNRIDYNGYRRFHTYQDNQHSWSVLQHIYRKQFKLPQKKYACLLLNILEDSKDLFTKYNFIWDEASLKVAVDGSANFLASRRLIHTADVVCGDFDSIDPKLVEKLRYPDEAAKLFTPKDHMISTTVKMPQIIETPTQRETDFTKAIRVAMSKRADINFFFALYHSDGSRIDHLFGLINTLHIFKKNIIIVNINSNTISWLLGSGSHVIHKPKGRELCSLVPFVGSAEVKTQGLEYNLGNSIQLNFGGLISTSNICRRDCKAIAIETNRELLWSIDICI